MMSGTRDADAVGELRLMIETKKMSLPRKGPN